MKQPEKGSKFAIKLMTWASFCFGRTLTRPIVYLIALFYLVFASSARKASRQYLSRSLDRLPTLFEQYKHFLYFSTVTHDRLYLLSGRFNYFQFSISGENEIRDALSSGKGVMLYGAHFGSFEAVKYSANKEQKQKIALLMYEENSRQLLDILKEIFPDFAQSIIPLGSIGTMIDVKDRLDRGYMIGLLADRAVNEEKRLQTMFLGQDASFPEAPFKLQGLFKCPAIFIAGVYLGGNKYQINFHNLAIDGATLSSNELQESYVRTLEILCKAYPFDWFNFYDFWGSA
ncbi:LpxL/LpxP family acyltransferase [Fluviibacter sp.]